MKNSKLLRIFIELILGITLCIIYLHNKDISNLIIGCTFLILVNLHLNNSNKP